MRTVCRELEQRAAASPHELSGRKLHYGEYHIQASFTFDSNGGETQTRTQTVTPGSNGTLSLSATFNFQSPGTYTVTASGTISRLITNITSTPVYDPNTKVRVGTNTSQTQRTTTSIMSVKQLVTVTAP